MHNEYAMRAWFLVWNSGVQAAREMYDLNREAETDRSLRTQLNIELRDAEAEQDGRKAEARVRTPPKPKMCRNRLHELTPQNIVNVRRCLACKEAWAKRNDGRHAEKMRLRKLREAA
jgi:hypothetical protein